MSKVKVVKQKTPDELAKKFVVNAGRLIDNLILVLPEREKITCHIVRTIMCETLDPHKVIMEFILHSQGFWEEIETENENFFIDADHANKIFGNLPLQKVLDFKSYWLELNEENKVVVRAYFKKFVEYAREYDLITNKKKTE